MDLAYTTSSRIWPWGIQQFDCRETHPFYDPMTGQWIWSRVCIKQENNGHDKCSDLALEPIRYPRIGTEPKAISGVPSVVMKRESTGGRNEDLLCVSDYLPREPSKANGALAAYSSNRETPLNIGDTDITHYTRVCFLPSTSDASSIKNSKNDTSRKQVVQANPSERVSPKSIDKARFKPTRDPKGRFVGGPRDKNTNSQVSRSRDRTGNQIGENPFPCPHCEKTFSYASNLKRHLRSHSGEKPYVCKECNKTFADPSNLGKHIRIHTGEKPYSCEECDKPFSDTSSLNKHLRTHVGDKLYECSECSKKFCDISNLIRHQRIHSGEKPYVCLQCNKSFSQASSLRKHFDVNHVRRTVIQRA